VQHEPQQGLAVQHGLQHPPQQSRPYHWQSPAVQHVLLHPPQQSHQSHCSAMLVPPLGRTRATERGKTKPSTPELRNKMRTETERGSASNKMKGPAVPFPTPAGSVKMVDRDERCLVDQAVLAKILLGEAISILSVWDISHSCTSPGPHPESLFRRFRGLEPMIILSICCACAAASDHIASSVRSSLSLQSHGGSRKQS
jgi:hypothetical protein